MASLFIVNDNSQQEKENAKCDNGCNVQYVQYVQYVMYMYNMMI